MCFSTFVNLIMFCLLHSSCNLRFCSLEIPKLMSSYIRLYLLSILLTSEKIFPSFYLHKKVLFAVFYRKFRMMQFCTPKTPKYLYLLYYFYPILMPLSPFQMVVNTSICRKVSVIWYFIKNVFCYILGAI